jgi:hypothetical protein
MAHYAFLDDNHIVTEVIVGKDEGEEGIDWEAHYGDFRGQICKQTSYNTRGGKYYTPNSSNLGSDQSKAFRKNYAGIGFTYDATRDAFIPPKPYPSWILNEQTCWWDAPIPNPNDGKSYIWNEETQSWDLTSEN